MADITPEDLELRVDIDPTDEMSDHAQQHNAANKAIVDLVNELGGEVDPDGNISGVAGGIPEPQAEDAGKVLATDGNNYDWAQLTTEYLPLADPQDGIDAFGITDEPANTQKEANEAFLKWIGINTNSIEGLADALGLVVKIENDNIVIEIDPSGDGILDVSNKFDRGDGDLEYETAVILGQAVKNNAEDISTNKDNITINSENFTTLLAELNLEIDGEGNISVKPGDPNNPSLDISSKFDKGPDSDLTRARIYDNAALMEAAIKANAAEIANVGDKIDDIIENELPELEVDLAGYFPKYVEGDTEQDALVYPAASVMGTAVAKNLDDIATEKTERIAGDENALAEVAKKYDAGVVPENEARTYPDAYALEQAVETNAENITTNATNIEANTTNIENVVNIIGGEVTDGNITLPDPIDIDSKLDKGTDLVAKDAKELEDKIGENTANISANAANIEAVVEVLGGEIENISGIEIDALPDQTGADGKFLTTNGSIASWADIDIPEGQNVTVSEDLPTASDGDNGDWWICTTPTDTGFAVGIELENYEPDVLLGTYTQGAILNSSGRPATNTIHVAMHPTASVKHDHNASNLCTNESNGSLDADFWMDFEVGDIVYYKVYAQSDKSVIGTMAYEVMENPKTITNGYGIKLKSLENSGIANWGTPNIVDVYVGVDSTNAVEPPPAPEKEKNGTLFYKDNDEWLQIGDGSGGGGSNGLPDGGNEGEFITLDDQGDAVWVDADVFPKGTSSYDDAGAMEDALNKKIDELGDELSGVVTPVGSANYNVKQGGGAESGDAVTGSLNPAVIAQITFGLTDANGNSTNFAGISTGDTLKIDNNNGANGEYTIAGHYMVSQSVQLPPFQGPNGETVQSWTTKPLHYVMQLENVSGEGTLTEGENVEFTILGVGEGRAVSAEYVDAQDAKKFDLAGIDGEGPQALTNARTMENAIAETINSLGWSLEITAEGEVTIKPPAGSEIESLTDKLSRGGTKYKDAKEIEDAIDNIQGFETLTFVDSVATFDELPAPADGKDKMYFVENEGVFYASNGTGWIKLSEFGITADEIADINNQLVDKFNLKNDAGEAPEFYLNALLVENSLDRKDTQLTILVNALGYEWGTDENEQPVLVPIGGGGDGVEESILATKFDKGTSEDNELSYADAYHMGVAIDEAALKVSTLEEKVESLETNTPEGLATEEYVDNALIPYAKQEDLTLLAAEVELKATLMHVTQAEYDNLMSSDSIDKNTLYVVSA